MARAAAFVIGTGRLAARRERNDGVLPPGQLVPNDNYTREESHKLLTFVVPRTARVTVVTRGIHSMPVTVVEFAQLLKGATRSIACSSARPPGGATGRS